MSIDIKKSISAYQTEDERWSFCEAALLHAKENGELPLAPMRRQWVPLFVRGEQKNIPKSYSPKDGERWITVHPNGEDGKGGQPLLIKEHEDGSASVIAGAGGKLNGLRLRKTKNKEEYRNTVRDKKEKIKQKKAAAKEAEKAKEKNMDKEEREGYREQKKEKRAAYKQKKQEIKEQKEQSTQDKAHEIAESLGWQVTDLRESFAPRQNELEEALQDAKNEQEKKGIERGIKDHQAALKLAQKRQAQNILAQARQHVRQFQAKLVKDDELRESVKSQLGEEPQAPLANQNRNGLGIKTEYKKKAGLTPEEQAQAARDRDAKLAKQIGPEKVAALSKAKESLKARNAIIEELAALPEYASPEDTEQQVAALKTVMEYEKIQQQVSQAPKELSKIDPTQISIRELQKELANTKFSEGIHLDADDLKKTLEKAVAEQRIERQAALNSTLHDDYSDKGSDQKNGSLTGPTML